MALPVALPEPLELKGLPNMTTNIKTIATTSTVDSLIGACRAHVLGRVLPAPVAVHIWPGERRIEVQSGGQLDLCSRLGTLLVWAYTLSDVTAEWWHTSGGSLHVSVIGRTIGGTRMKAYGGGDFDECRGLVPLAVGESESVSLDELYALVGLLREANEHREVA